MENIHITTNKTIKHYSFFYNFRKRNIVNKIFLLYNINIIDETGCVT